MNTLKQFILSLQAYSRPKLRIRKSIGPFKITYTVDVLTDLPLRLIILYCDSEGRAVVHTTAKRWSQMVTLPAGQIASLHVTIAYNRDFRQEDCSSSDSRILVLGKIISEGKMISEYSDNMIMIALSQFNS